MIRHTVIFKLRHAKGSAQESDFLSAAEVLARIPSVRRFERLKQVSLKNSFDFGFSMEFDSAQGYDEYNAHPEHIRFVETRWKPEVLDFLEIDYTPYAGP
jgi:hypothetical protein